GYIAWQNGRIQGAQNAVQNAGVQSGGNQNGLVVVPRIANQNGTGNVIAARAEGDLDEIEEVNANCILMENLQQASTSGTQHDKAPVYDTYGSAKYTDLLKPIPEPQLVPQNDNHVTSVAPSMVHSVGQASTSGTQHDKAPVYDTDGSDEVQLNDNYYDNEIFNMFTQEEQYTDLVEPIPEPQLVPQNDNHVTSVTSSMVHSEGTVKTSSTPNEETCAHQKTIYRNLVDQVAQ
nr:hypothetical protein [Tanacetum cinerariifolium]